MHVSVNGVRLFFDVEGAKLVPDGPRMREKPTLLMLHGGPGFDHSIYKPAYSALADIAQVVYLDHRGNGRSEDGPPESWNLAQWGDDVRTFCDVLGIADPIVLGASFGGMVALAYATRHPDHPSKLVLISTEAEGDSYLDRRVALFERFGGPEVGELARRRFLDADDRRDQAAVDAWRKLAFPVYIRTPRDPNIGSRTIGRPEVGLRWWAKPDGESHAFNMFPDLHRIRCPTLVLGGEDDPMHPIESQADIAAALPAHLVQFERFANCGHAVVPDAPERAMAVLRDFIARRGLPKTKPAPEGAGENFGKPELA
jgi:proline iminopeptidase